MRLRSFFFGMARLKVVIVATGLLAGCANAPRPPKAPPTPPARAQPAAAVEGVQLGIDVLEQQNFRALQGKRIGLLTHPAAVNRFGVSTADVLLRDKRNNVVALFAGEHGIFGTIPAGQKFEDHVDSRTGLPVKSLYTGRTHKPTPEQLRGIDVLVFDMQDIGTRSYTFIGTMRFAMEACFENNVAIVILDRPNPLGGLKVSGPIMEREYFGLLGAYPIPYVHGLTVGELARMAWSEPGLLQIPDAVRTRGRITVVPMRGWRRDMTWPETGLRWIPTSPNIPDFEAVVGYPMTGLGAQLGGFQHGLRTAHPFRLLSHPNIPQAELLNELNRRALAGLRFTPRAATLPPAGRDPNPRPVAGVFVEVTDWNAWRPTELNFHMMQLAAAASAPRNPFAEASADAASLFNRHVGSSALWNALKRDAARLNAAALVAQWEREAQAFQNRSRKYWMYR